MKGIEDRRSRIVKDLDIQVEAKATKIKHVREACEEGSLMRPGKETGSKPARGASKAGDRMGRLVKDPVV